MLYYFNGSQYLLRQSLHDSEKPSYFLKNLKKKIALLASSSKLFCTSPQRKFSTENEGKRKEDLQKGKY